MSRTLPISLVLVLIAIAVARSVGVWDELPAQVASHFGPSGQPDRWQSKADFFWVYGLFGLATTAVLLAMPLLTRWLPPQTINIPYRDYWLVPERIDEARRKLAGYMAWFAVAITLLLVVTLELVLRANASRTKLDEAVFLSCLAGFALFTLAWLVVMYRSFRPPDGP